MTNETYREVREVLEDLAQSRGFRGGAEELTERVHQLDASYGGPELLEEPRPGSGPLLEKVLGGLTEEERDRLARGVAQTLFH